MNPDTSTTSVFRIDKFIVPAPAREAFLAAVRDTQTFLGRRDGCMQNLVLEQMSGPGKFNFVTVLEWRDQAAFEGARNAIAKWREDTGFDPGQLLESLGIAADMVNYEPIAIE